MTALAALAGAIAIQPRAGAADPTVRRVEIEKFAFVPARLELRPGDVVEWVNMDIAPHTATARDGTWDTEGLVDGQSAAITFRTPGTFPYVCAYHPNMRGEVAVIGD